MKNAEENIEYYYPLAGTFTHFLINKFGLEKYREFYTKIHRKNTQEENIRIFERIFGNLNKIQENYFRSVVV